MRPVRYNVAASLDEYIAGPGGEVSLHYAVTSARAP